ncbi:MAG TPA: hypothetical protein VFO76_10860, partial [Candidatus Kapabacteria bacterium]|nr:hypothetical protein [Candidatus Kapabacteria bacterium]
MVVRIFLFLILLAAIADAQVCTRPGRIPSKFAITDHYLQYTINYDSSAKLFFLRDSLIHKDTYIDIPYAHWPRFREGFVWIPQGDMKALMSLDGRILLTTCHTINLYGRYISAFRCCTGWIFLNKNGDTLSSGNGGDNYIPSISPESLSPAYILQHDTAVRYSAKKVWG